MSLIGASLIGAGGNILSGLLGSGGSSPTNAGKLTRKYNKRQARRARADTLRFNRQSRRFSQYWNRKQLRHAKQQSRKAETQLKYGIRRRVKDAKAAGLHPLFALGANPGAFSGSSFSVGTPAGSGFQANQIGGPNGLSVSDDSYTFGDALGDLAQAGQGYFTARHARKLQAAKFELEAAQVGSGVQLNEAMTNYYNSLAAKATQDAVAHAGGRRDPTQDLTLGPPEISPYSKDYSHRMNPVEHRSTGYRYDRRTGRKAINYIESEGEEYGQILNAINDMQFGIKRLFNDIRTNVRVFNTRRR